jgi:Transposase
MAFGLFDYTQNGKPDHVAVAIEVPRGPVVEALLEGGLVVFSINPKQLDRFRDRYTVAGAKDDSRDAYVAADSLRTDQHCFRRIAADHPDVVRLRELSRTEESLGEDFRRVVNQPYQLLLRYYPQLLQLNSTPDEPWIWALLELAPIPQRRARLTVARLKALLSKHRIRRCHWPPAAPMRSASMPSYCCRNCACSTASVKKSATGSKHC